MVFYRKYRPQTIAELDSESLRQSLITALSGSETPHAFLFTGPKGLGKTSTARIVAKVLNCTAPVANRGGGIEPCNECDQCISITKGTNVDILEIDGASNRGIDEIRDLREKIRLLPVSANKKVYIIDEVHMLTTEAFNALLKTLEEPPPHAAIILCTTEPHKVPGTILSRSHHIAFKKATQDELVHSFKRIAKAEKMTIDDEALIALTRISDGSFRDGVKALEDAMRAFPKKHITEDMVSERFGTTGLEQSAHMLFSACLAGDMQKGLSDLDELILRGTDVQYILSELLTFLHTLLLAKVGVTQSEDSELASKIGLADIKAFFIILSEAHSQMRFALLPRLPLELAIVGMASLKKPQEIQKEEKIEVAQPVVSKPKETVTLGNHQEKDEVWEKFITRMKEHNRLLVGILNGCKMQKHDQSSFVIEASAQFHKDRLTDPKALVLLEQVAKELLGDTIQVSVVLKST